MLHILGLCFPWAGKYVIDQHNEGAVLCHGRVTMPFSDPPEQILHAWVEHNGLCLDWQTMEAGCGGIYQGKGYPIGIFYELYTPDPVVKYDYSEALDMLVSQTHWGPWHARFNLFVDAA